MSHPEFYRYSIGQRSLRADEIRDPRKLSQLYGREIRINPLHSCSSARLLFLRGTYQSILRRDFTPVTLRSVDEFSPRRNNGRADDTNAAEFREFSRSRVDLIFADRGFHPPVDPFGQ